MATIPSSLVVDNLCGQNPTLGEQHKSEHKLGSDFEGSNLCCRLSFAKGRILLRSDVLFQIARISDQTSCFKSDVILKLDVRSEQDVRSQFGHRCSCLISKKLSFVQTLWCAAISPSAARPFSSHFDSEIQDRLWRRLIKNLHGDFCEMFPVWGYRL